MSVERREQVFVSSTYLDLRDERQAVMQTLLEADCLPAGMELFPASDSEKWELIRSVIDDSDYYVVVVGGRYGSVGEDGLSFTEKEFDYAVETKTPVMGFLHGDPGMIVQEKADLDPVLRDRLQAFRTKVEQRMVKYWTTADDLSGALAISLIKTRKSHPAVGWVRGNDAMSPEIETEIAQLRERVATLTRQLETDSGFSQDVDTSDLAQGGDEYRLPIVVKYWNGDDSPSDYNAKYLFDRVTTTWDRVFGSVAVSMFDEASETVLDEELDHLAVALVEDQFESLEFPSAARRFSRAHQAQREAVGEVVLQFVALGLIRKSTKRHPVNDSATYWTLTERGHTHLTRLRALRKGQAEPPPVLEDDPVTELDHDLGDVDESDEA